jgi:hypothetical protein
MQIIDNETMSAGEAESVTFAVSATSQVSGVTGSVDGGPGMPLPVTVVGHHQVTVTVGFTGDTGGSADIRISGSAGGAQIDTIAQVTGLPFRNRVYTT